MNKTLKTLTWALALTTLQATATLKPDGKTIKNQLLASAKVDLATDSATLPLQMGYLTDGRKVFFVLTDSSDQATAKRLGLVYAPDLAMALKAKSTRTATIDKAGVFTFTSGTVDFKPVRALTPGDAPAYFPPKSFTPGSVADANYSPFVKIQGTNIVYNAPIVAFDVEPKQISFCKGSVDYSLVHDKVLSICPKTMEVSLKMTHGFASGDEVLYLSFDSNNPLPATMEAATYTPATADLVASGAADNLYAIANGATGKANPDRQGFNSALAGEGSPLNILDGLNISSTDYTPLWDVNVAVWSAGALKANQRHLIKDGNMVYKLSEDGQLTNPSGGKVGSLGLLVNCPVIGFLK